MINWSLLRISLKFKMEILKNNSNVIHRTDNNEIRKKLRNK